MMDALRADPRLAHQLLLLAHLYARTDGWALAWLRASLLRPRWGRGRGCVMDRVPVGSRTAKASS
jgi:hypothetical protein